MKKHRKELIALCDNFLNGQVDKAFIHAFATEYDMSDQQGLETDNILLKTLVEWRNERLNFPINESNVRLWKERLLTEVDKLSYCNDWNVHMDNQRSICDKYNSRWIPANKHLKVGISTDLHLDPINGLRHPADPSTTGWFIWTGEFSQRNDFFQPLCAEHLLQTRPGIIKYLALDVGFRFLVTESGYEDVWYDKNLLSI